MLFKSLGAMATQQAYIHGNYCEIYANVESVLAGTLVMDRDYKILEIKLWHGNYKDWF